MNKENIESIYPLSPMQEGMLFHSIDGKKSKVYVVVLHFSLHGALNVSAFRRAWQEVLDRHPVLRTFFIWKHRGTPLQIVARRIDLPWQEYDWRYMPASEQTELLKSYAQTDRKKGYNLSKAPLMRLTLVQTTQNDHHFFFSHHHILLDGWSVALLLKEVFAVYQTNSSGKKISLEELQPYKTYITWLKQQDLSEAELYWRKTLQGFTQPTPIYLDEALGNKQSSIEVYDEQHLRLSRTTTAGLQLFAQHHQITLSTLIHGVWALLLNRYSGETDVVFGTVVSGRSIALPGIESMIGLFINTLPVRVPISPQASLMPWLKESQGQQVQARKFEHSSLRNIQAWSELVRSQGQSLFDSILVFGNYPLNDLLNDVDGDLEIGNTSILEGSNYPLSVLIDPSKELTIRMNYDTHRFDDTTIVQILKHFQTLLEAFTVNPYQPLSAFSPLTAEETKKLLEEFNQTTVSYPTDKTLFQLFEAQIAKTPDNVAVQDGQDYLTYAQLNRRANQIAHYLGQFELGSPGLVCLYLARSCDMIAAILGVLKAGGAYVPLDPIYPPARLALLLDDIAQATPRGKPIVITQPELADNLPLKAVNSVCLGNDQAKISQCLDTNPLPYKTAQDIAYVLYTSGSTGVPKGVCCHHRGVINLLSDFQRRQAIKPGDSCSWWTSISFDVSVYEIFSALLYGAKLYIVPEEIRADRDGFIAWISKHQIQNAYVPPSMVGKLADESERPSVALTLRRLLVGVEPISEPLLATICKNVPGCRIINGYGPTEATVCATLYDVTASQTPKRNVPIGRAVQNMQIYLLDHCGQIVPFGVPGEIHIGGVGVAQGYLNRPNRTAERFIADPFNPKSQARLYKTGDIARYLPDGNLQFIGRTDFQIKFRGYRIEPGEIEAALRQHPAVRDTAVIVREDEPNDQRLVGYIVPSENQTVDKHGLRRYLNQKLPPYMVPNVFVLLDALPLTPSDKVDRKGLPKPTTNDTMHGTDDYIAPRSPSEQILAAIWADVFGLSQVSIEANFFDLGGDSIINIQIITRANQAGLDLEPRQLFKNQTIGELAAVADEANPIQTEQGPVTGHVPLTPIQHWFFRQNLAETSHWNQTIVLSTLANLDLSALESAIQYLLQHHDALRLRYQRHHAGWQQMISEAETPFVLQYEDLYQQAETECDKRMEQVQKHLQSTLCIKTGDLVRAVYFKLGDERPGRLLILIHHLAVDGVSWNILVEDLETAYQQLCQGHPVSLTAKTTSFKQWSTELTAYARSRKLQSAELNFWLSMIQTPVTALPVDFASDSETSTVATSRKISAVLGVEGTKALLRDVPGVYNTQMNDVLLTALIQVLSDWTDGDCFCVDLEGHGREDIMAHVDISRTVGWFTNIYPAVLALEPKLDPGAALKRIKEQLRRIPKRGIGYGLLRYLTQGTISQSLEPFSSEILFNYFGQLERMVSHSVLFGLAQRLTDSFGPRNKVSHRLSINACILKEQLHVEWVYSTELYHADTIQNLAAAYIRFIKAIIEHCLGTENGCFTPSDFPLANLDENKLSQLSKILKTPE